MWTAVESGDAAGLAGLLGLRDEEHASLYALLPSLSSWRRARQERVVLDAARYRVAWHPAATGGAPVLDGTWLAVTTAPSRPDGDPAPGSPADEAAEVLDALRGHGAVVRHLVLDETHLDRDRLAETLRAAVETAAADGRYRRQRRPLPAAARRPGPPRRRVAHRLRPRRRPRPGPGRHRRHRPAVDGDPRRRHHRPRRPPDPPARAAAGAWAGQPPWSGPSSGAAWSTCRRSSTPRPSSAW
ncbi:hypothetical protein [Streptomyces sp. SS52]|uniref:hypothetical protein n=1 Tax=Streptomyces sp. SS52 TaxID=2563602 RepID=UPI0032B5A0D3